MRKGVLGVFLVLLLAACGNESAKLDSAPAQGAAVESQARRVQTVPVRSATGRISKPLSALVPPGYGYASIPVGAEIAADGTLRGDFGTSIGAEWNEGDRLDATVNFSYKPDGEPYSYNFTSKSGCVTTEVDDSAIGEFGVGTWFKCVGPLNLTFETSAGGMMQLDGEAELEWLLSLTLGADGKPKGFKLEFKTGDLEIEEKKVPKQY